MAITMKIPNIMTMMQAKYTRKSDCRSVVCDGDEVEKEDGREGQELDGHDHFLDDQDQDQCHPVDDRSQHPSRSFRPGLFSDCTLKEEMEKVFSFQIMFSHSPSNQISAGGRLSHCWTLRPGCLSWVEHIHYTNTNTQIQTHKYKHTNTQIQQYTNTQITKNKYTNTQSWWSYPHNDYNHLYVK